MPPQLLITEGPSLQQPTEHNQQAHQPQLPPGWWRRLRRRRRRRRRPRRLLQV